MAEVLLLNSDYSPIRVVSWERAITMLLSEKVSLVAQYADRVIRSPSTTLPWPAVVMLKAYSKMQNRVRFNRANVMARDLFRCQYCGLAPKTREGRPQPGALTLDHVVPRAQSRDGTVVIQGRRFPLTGWENVVACCKDCNRKKAARTPEQAGMRLLAVPRRPSPWDAVRLAFGRAVIPNEWSDFLPGDDVVLRR